MRGETGGWGRAIARRCFARRLRLVIACLALASIMPCVAWAEEPSGAGEVVVAVIPAQPGAYTVTLPDKVGVLEAARSLELGFEVAGRVEEILEQGSRVEAGQVVARLDSALEEAELRRSALLLEDALSELRRVQGLQKSRAASESALDAARTAAGLRRAERDAARERLDRRQLRARFAGVIADVDIEPGEVTVPGRPVAKLLDHDVMKLEVGVPGRQIGRVEPDAAVDVVVPALRDARFEGHVRHVAPSAANGGALFEVEIEVPNPDGRLRPGMSARASIVTEIVPDAVAVPVQAAVPRDGRRVVYFVEGERAVAVDATRAQLHGDVLVLRGQPSARPLVVRGQHDLGDGMRVRIDDSVLEGHDAPATGLRVEVLAQ